ncbi:MAG: M48 family metalloprotease [Paracoccaceae bacterium]
MRVLARIHIGLLSLGLVLAACAPQQQQPTAERASTLPAPAKTKFRSASEQKLGDENHQKIIAKYGGVYDNARLTSYVDALGRDLAAVSEQPGDKWTFTVLDNPTINAFALPGGYVYVTRGLVALANSEAELAGVIGHEIGHVTAGHSSLRQDRAAIATGAVLGAQILGAVLGADPQTLRGLAQLGQAAAGGVLASYSRDDELAADNLGIRYLALGGYDPYAQADFLESMGAAAQLNARAAGKSYDPNATNFFASHPATGPRTRRAIEIARQSGLAIPVGANRDRESFLGAVDGILYGENPDQGFVRGQEFAHPKLRFAYRSPDGFRINNTPAAVIASGQGGARFVLDSGRGADGSLSAYIQRLWVPEISKQYRTAQLSTPRPQRINGLEAASATTRIQVNNQVYDALLVAIRMDGKLYRLTGLSPRGAGLLPRMAEAARTFRRLRASEARQMSTRRVDVVTVRRGDTVASLARRMKVDKLPEDRFRVLNALKPSDTLRAGQKVKLVR